jgi:hypothetical protein
MNHIKLAGDLSMDVSKEIGGNDMEVAGAEIRALKDLELVLVGGGGDAVPIWE